MQPTIQKVSIPGLTLSARVWGPEGGYPVLALHGWLDNAASFDLLAPLLPKCRIISVDLPGHGFSDHLPASASYNNPDRVIHMLNLVDELGWKEFSVIGHSLGGIIAQMMAAVIPERIKKVVLIDILDAMSKPADTIVFQLKKYYLAQGGMLVTTLYPSLEIAAEKRAQMAITGEIALKSAQILVEGGMQKVPGGYSWTFDKRLQLPTLLMLTDEQSQTIRTHFKSRTIAILGRNGIVNHPRSRQDAQSGMRNTVFPNIRIFELEGGHHLHLDNPEPLAKIINDFFN